MREIRKNIFLTWKFTLPAIVLLICYLTLGYAGDLKLRWDANSEPDLAGYKFYYKTESSGDRIPGSYNGTGLREGISPIDVPLNQDENPDPAVVDFTVHDLNDDQTYFFAVVAYDEGGQDSGASWEVSSLAPNSLSPPYDRGWEITSGDFKGVKMLYNSNDVATPTLGPTDEIPVLDLPDVDTLGVPLNLQPSGAHFDIPVTLFIPCPGYSDVSGIDIYYYDGTNWVLSHNADAPDTVQVAAQGFVVPGSRVNHNVGSGGSTEISTIEIQVYHFSGIQGGVSSASLPPDQGEVPPGGSVVVIKGAGAGGGCFFSMLKVE